MLRSFRVANHRSLREEQQLNLLPADDLTKFVVPVAAIFGANASGKSNLLHGLSWMRSAVLESHRWWETDSGIPRFPFVLDRAAAANPSSYIVDLMLDGIPYTYGFSADGGAVVEEWLSAYPHNRERVLFSREGKRVELGSTVPERRSRADFLTRALRGNALLLSTAVQLGQEDFLPVYRWFRDGLRIQDNQRAVPGPALANAIARAVEKYPHFVTLMKAADLGIADVIVDEPLGPSTSADPPPSRPAVLRATLEAWQYQLPEPARKIRFRMAAGTTTLGLSDQSDGTLSWTRLLIAALSALDEGGTLVVDEIDESLHPRLTARLFELFRHASTNGRGAQLIFTTHDATLLGSDLGDEEVLHRDEIWFIQKRDGASTVFPLSDFHPRKETDRVHRYLLGSYGAVPVTFTDSLVDSVNEIQAETPGA